MNFKEIVHARYATKAFNSQSIPDETFNELIDLIRFTPSSFNIQPWKIKVVTDPALKEQLRHASFDQPQITTCSHLLVMRANTDIYPLIDALEASMKERGVPEAQITTVTGMMRMMVSHMTDADKLAWAQRQLYIALGNAVNGAKSLGFDSCPMEGFDNAKFSEILALPAHLHPTALCPVGYAADQKMEKFRFSREEILI